MINFGLFSTISLANRQAVCYDISSQLGAFNFSAPKKKLEENIMIEKIRAMKNKKGFTLVELIVVLVILAILAALLIPALTGYIDKANKEKVVSETRMVAMAVQTECSEAYGQLKSGEKLGDWSTTVAEGAVDHIKNIKDLAEVLDATGTSFKAEVYTDGSIKTVIYSDGTYYCTYDAEKKTYTTVKVTTTTTAPDNTVKFVTKSAT